MPQHWASIGKKIQSEYVQEFGVKQSRENSKVSVNASFYH